EGDFQMPSDIKCAEKSGLSKPTYGRDVVLATRESINLLIREFLERGKGQESSYQDEGGRENRANRSIISRRAVLPGRARTRSQVPTARTRQFRLAFSSWNPAL